MESRRVPGLHFIGEVVDVTGWLGGYNFQWAWASAAACARAPAAGGHGRLGRCRPFALESPDSFGRAVQAGHTSTASPEDS